MPASRVSGMSHRYEFTAELWPWRARNQLWTFVTVPPDISDEIADDQPDLKRGFGAVKVRVTVGAAVWKTSLFPSKEQAAYILPVKSTVRKDEGLELGDQVTAHIELIEA